MPTSASAHSNYATALKAAGRPVEALPIFEAALALDPGYARGYNNYGSALTAIGGEENLRHAEQLHRTAIALMPTLASAYNNLGNALTALYRPAEAAAALEAAIGLDPYYGAAYTNLAAAHRADADADAAIRAAAVGVSLLPASAEAHNGLGASLQLASRAAEAAAAFEEAAALAPTSSTFRLNAGNALKAAGRLQDALDAYGTALTLSATAAEASRAYNALGATLQASGEQSLAARAYATALDLLPDDPIAAANLNKLPTGDRYRAAAAAETAAAAARAAAASLAVWGARRAGRIHAGAGASGEAMAVALHRSLRYLRRLETGQAELAGGGGLWASRSAEMPEVLHSREGGEAAPMTLAAFAWGGVWFPSFMRAFAHPLARAAITRAAAGGGGAVVLGSSLGFEAYFASLTFGMPTVGVEILCSLAELSEGVRVAQAVPTSLTKFECADALEFTLPPGTMLVYADDTAWDPPALAALASKLAAELPDGAIVVHNSEAGFDSQPRFALLETVAVSTSWNPTHPVHVHIVGRGGVR